MTAKANPGHEAVEVKGWFGAHKWLLARRFSQVAILALFLVGPLFGYYIVKGTIASSLTLDVLPLTDPFMLIQSWLAGHQLESTALIGAAIVVVTYLIVGGRVYCSWVCPEQQVITPALRGADKGVGPVILSPNCTNCGRCIDVCSLDVFEFGTRFNNRSLTTDNKENGPVLGKAA